MTQPCVASGAVPLPASAAARRVGLIHTWPPTLGAEHDFVSDGSIFACNSRKAAKRRPTTQRLLFVRRCHARHRRDHGGFAADGCDTSVRHNHVCRRRKGQGWVRLDSELSTARGKESG